MSSTSNVHDCILLFIIIPHCFCWRVEVESVRRHYRTVHFNSIYFVGTSVQAGIWIIMRTSFNFFDFKWSLLVPQLTHVRILFRHRTMLNNFFNFHIYFWFLMTFDHFLKKILSFLKCSLFGDWVLRLLNASGSWGIIFQVIELSLKFIKAVKSYKEKCLYLSSAGPFIIFVFRGIRYLG